ncbi:MAG TPA: peroxiredoxin-like family protein [Pseudolabrys sp.]|nr:peroxiredoxin-like family protein [Pseudolabrys sp.]
MRDPDTAPKTGAEAFARAERLDAALNERLAAYAALSRHVRPDIGEAYDRLVAHLTALQRGDLGPRLGEAMPDFLLPDAEGRLISRDSLLHDGPLIVSINRGHWCPYCRLELRALAAIADEIKDRGAQLVSIMPETARYTKAAARDSGFPFTILTDVDLGYTLSLGLIYWVGAELQELYAKAKVELDRFQGNQSYFLPIAGKFILDQGGTIRARQIDVDFRRRMEPQAILAALDSL